MSTVSPVTSQKTSQMIGDMKFVGIFTIVYGAITCLSIVGAIIGIPMIIMGMRLRESAEFYTSYQVQKDDNTLHLAFEKQGSYFNIQKILIIIGMVIFGLYLVGAIIFAGIMLSRGL